MKPKRSVTGGGKAKRQGDEFLWQNLGKLGEAGKYEKGRRGDPYPLERHGKLCAEYRTLARRVRVKHPSDSED